MAMFATLKNYTDLFPRGRNDPLPKGTQKFFQELVCSRGVLGASGGVSGPLWTSWDTPRSFPDHFLAKNREKPRFWGVRVENAPLVPPRGKNRKILDQKMAIFGQKFRFLGGNYRLLALDMCSKCV